MKHPRHKRTIRQLWTEWNLAREMLLDRGLDLVVEQSAIITGIREAMGLQPGEVEGMKLIGYCRNLKARVADLEQMLEQMRVALHMRTVAPTSEQEAVAIRRARLAAAEQMAHLHKHVDAVVAVVKKAQAKAKRKR